MEIPAKKEGKPYCLVFRLPEYSSVRTGLLKTFGGKDSAPGLFFENKCVCCNAVTSDFKEIKPESIDGSFHAVNPVKIPLCPDCETHITKIPVYWGGILFVIGLGLLISGIYYKTIYFIIPGVVLLVIGIVISLILILKEHNIKSIPGHYGACTIRMQPKQTIVLTSNRRLAERLVKNNHQYLYEIT